jgi:hypothetical protein
MWGRAAKRRMERESKHPREERGSVRRAQSAVSGRKIANVASPALPPRAGVLGWRRGNGSNLGYREKGDRAIMQR